MNYANISNNDFAYQNFMLYEKSLICHQGFTWTNCKLCMCVCVCVHIYVEVFVSKPRFIFMLMPLNDIKCCHSVCYKN